MKPPARVPHPESPHPESLHPESLHPAAPHPAVAPEVAPGTVGGGGRAGDWVLDDLPAPLRALLVRLGDRTAVAEAVAHGARPEEVAALFADLGAAGLIRPGSVDGAGARTGRRDAYVRVHGADRLGVAVATGLAGAGVGRVAVRAPGPVTPDDLGTGLTPSDVGHPGVLAVAAAVARVAAEVVVAEPTRGRPDLVVLVGAAEPAVVGTLHARHQPHLAVVAHAPGGTVGPLVLPGRTSCLHCAARHGGAQRPPPSGPAVPVALATVLAGLVVGQVLAYLAGGPGLLDAVDVIDPDAGTMVRHAVGPHPMCRCLDAPGRAPVVRAGDNRGRGR